MTEIVLQVVGLPTGQGSKKAWVNPSTGRAQMREQSSDRIHLWRQDVKEAARQALDERAQWVPLEGPLDCSVTFRFPRPKSHYRTGRNAHLLRDNAPLFPHSRAVPDLDKALRATWDALNIAGLFTDDCQIVRTKSAEVYTNNPHQVPPGAMITIRTLDAPFGWARPTPAPEEATLL